MSRRRGTDELTFEAQRELEALEAALRREPVAPEHAALAELALALREERPQPSAKFARALDDRAAHGFRSAGRQERAGAQARGALGTRPLLRRRQAGGGPRWRVPRRRLAVGLGAGTALAAVVVAPVVAVAGGRPGRPRPAFATNSVAAPAVSGAGRADQLGTAERGPLEAAAPAIAGRAEAGPSGAARSIERTATLDVGVSRRSIQSIAGRVFTLVSAFGGYVRQSSVSSGSSGEDGASFDVRLPSARLSAATAALTPEASSGASSGNLTPGAAAKDAARILDAALAVLVLAAAALLPLAVILIAGWAAIALTRRRLREQALDAS